MPLEPFDLLFPDIGLAECRVCTVPSPDLGVPPAKYLLREWYCTDADCDCRRVVVEFIADTSGAPIGASINFGWEKVQYYRKWTRDPVLARELAGASVALLAEQGPQYKRFLPIFNHIIKDHLVVAAFRRHYRMVKERFDPNKVQTTDLPAAPAPPPSPPWGRGLG